VAGHFGKSALVFGDFGDFFRDGLDVLLVLVNALLHRVDPHGVDFLLGRFQPAGGSLNTDNDGLLDRQTNALFFFQVFVLADEFIDFGQSELKGVFLQFGKPQSLEVDFADNSDKLAIIPDVKVVFLDELGLFVGDVIQWHGVDFGKDSL
jgi:hypothetical protein